MIYNTKLTSLDDFSSKLVKKFIPSQRRFQPSVTQDTNYPLKTDFISFIILLDISIVAFLRKKRDGSTKNEEKIALEKYEKKKNSPLFYIAILIPTPPSFPFRSTITIFSLSVFTALIIALEIISWSVG